MDVAQVNSDDASLKQEETLEKMDTNKEEELRLLNLENDIMHKAFIQKSHRLNLESNLRVELMQRIQMHKEGQIQKSANNSSEEAVSSNGTT